MGRRVRLQVLDDSLPAGVEPCCGNCSYAATGPGGGGEYRGQPFPIRCKSVEAGPEFDRRLGPLAVAYGTLDEFGQLWVRPEFGCINWTPKQE